MDTSTVIFSMLQVILCDSDGWKMVTLDENKPRGLAPPFFQRILKTAWFHILILMLVLANAITTATIHFDHDKIDPYTKIDNYYYIEVSNVYIYNLYIYFFFFLCFHVFVITNDNGLISRQECKAFNTMTIDLLS